MFFVYLLEIMLKYLVIPLINITLRIHKNRYYLKLCKVNIKNKFSNDTEELDKSTDESENDSVDDSENKSNKSDDNSTDELEDESIDKLYNNKKECYIDNNLD